MNKAELVRAVSEILGDKKEAQAAVDSVLKAISNAMRDGESVTVAGFGSFKVVDRKERIGRNPQTGEQVRISAKKAPKFVPGKGLKEIVNPKPVVKPKRGKKALGTSARKS